MSDIVACKGLASKRCRGPCMIAHPNPTGPYPSARRVPLSPGPLAPPAADVLGQCLMINIWALLVFAIALPLHILVRLERRAGRLFWASRIDAVCAQQRRRPTPEARAEAVRLLYVPCTTPTELCLFACLAWHAARMAVMLLRGGAT